MLRYFVVSGLVLLLPATDSYAQTDFFESRIRPVLVEHCYACHNSSDVNEGELALDFRQGLLKGGSGGELIVPGDPASSRLIAILKHDVEGLEMPEDGPKLSDEIVADFERWIAEGAVDPRDEPPSADEIDNITSWEAIRERRKMWWSFQPILSSELALRSVGDHDAKHPVDRFIRSRLDKAELSPADPASPAVLIRRLFFALIGLPPTPQELEAWLTKYSAGGADRSEVTESLIDHLLESKQFGPRWARHWMDWIRYAESHGSEGDPTMKNAWMYRDYLIRALNDDIPYDQLVREHLAGDALDRPRINAELQLNESLLATIQLRMVFHGFSPTDALDEKVRFVDDQVNTISKAFLGLTVSCARCHDHKFDAISQADYYAMFGVFAACRPGRSVADAPQKLYKNRRELADLKPAIRAAVADLWIDSKSRISKQIQVKVTAEVPKSSLLATLKSWYDQRDKTPISNAWQDSLEQSAERKQKEQVAVRSWDLSQVADYDQWIQKGVESKAQKAGQFAVAIKGDDAIGGVYPGGVYSHLISDRHPLRISSPDVPLDGKYDYWVRAVGGQDAATRYVTQDYPRTGTVFQATKLQRDWTWHKLKLDYWEGDSVHFELATGPDIPLQASDKPRSWFGVSKVLVIPQGAPTPNNQIDWLGPIIAGTDHVPQTFESATQVVAEAIVSAVEAWKAGNCSDEQALLIDHAIRTGLLDNRLDSLASAKPLIQHYRDLEGEIQSPRRVPGLDDVPQRTQPLFVRGNHKQPSDPVPRRFLEAIDSKPYPVNESGRRQLAEDILRSDNPLSRRVIVNRVWHHLFGKGIVSTPDNFGRLGSKPSHPELLDYLAARFVEDGWSLKKLIRLVVSSESWQQASHPSADSIERDPDNVLLAHANVRRLEAESIRDAMLSAAGSIRLELQGQPVDANSNRRSVFLRVKRNSLDPMLRAFDFPEPHTAIGRRDVTNVPAQSLLMMNSPQVAGYAAQLANQVWSDDSERTLQQQIADLCLRVLSRQPTESESAALIEHLRNSEQVLKQLADQRNTIRAKLKRTEQQITSIIEPKRSELAVDREHAPKPKTVAPLAHWEFDTGVQDTVGELNGEAKDGAEIENGRLVVNNGGYGTTTPVAKSIQAKTLEAWVQLDTLEQRGGGVITLQTKDGNVFDSIVYAERQQRQWMAGSNGFARTNDFSGAPAETKAKDRMVHVAISYHADGTVVGYRDGQRYGKPYKTSVPHHYPANQAVVSFGVRHFPNQGNRRLAARIERASLYDRALSDEEVNRSFAFWSDQISDQQVMDALADAERTQIQQLRSRADSLAGDLESLAGVPDQYSDQQGWTDLARTMFMLKEFVYVR